MLHTQVVVIKMATWRQIHRTNCATHQTTNLGIQMDHPGSYISGVVVIQHSSYGQHHQIILTLHLVQEHQRFICTAKQVNHIIVFLILTLIETTQVHHSKKHIYHFMAVAIEVWKYLILLQRQDNQVGGDLRSGSTNSAFSDKDQDIIGRLSRLES